MKVFIDTSGWVALYDRNDQNHSNAKGLWKKIISQDNLIYTTFDVLDETITLLRFHSNYKQSLEFGETLFKSKIINIIETNEETREKAWEFYKKFSDKKLSLTDCTSFAVMFLFKISEVFTFDKHFFQVGFNPIV